MLTCWTGSTGLGVSTIGVGWVTWVGWVGGVTWIGLVGWTTWVGWLLMLEEVAG